MPNGFNPIPGVSKVPSPFQRLALYGVQLTGVQEPGRVPLLPWSARPHRACQGPLRRDTQQVTQECPV